MFLASNAAWADTKTGNLQVKIEITKACEVNTSGKTSAISDAELHFGAHGVLNTDIDEDTTTRGTREILIQCSKDTPYKIELNEGLNPEKAGDTATRRMTNGTEFVAYQLYQDANRSLIWGKAGAAISETADGTEQKHHIYGRVEAQRTPAAGSYTDTVTVTVTY